ncbi:MAG: SpoIIE family protein phosphatase [Oscillospiraceae bacterium]|nr:SpoIIE family protein phosphatase [Oscillospiraceae bacterium]
MMDWNELRTHPRVKQTAQMMLCGAAGCLLATVELNGMPVPMNTALSAALSPACGAAVLIGSAAAYALTGMLHKQPALLCALVLTAVLRWIFGVQEKPQTVAMLAAGSTLLSAVIFSLAGLIAGAAWIPWISGSILAGVLAYSVRSLTDRFRSGLPVRLHEADRLSFSVCYVCGIAALCTVRLMSVGFGEMIAAFVTLTAARRYRTSGGTVCGMLSALALVLANAETAGYAAMLPAAGFAAGCLAGRSAGMNYLAFQGFGALGLILSDQNAALAGSWVGGMLGGLAFLFLPAGSLADAVLQWSDSEADFAALNSARMAFLSHSIAGVRGGAERIAGMMAKSGHDADPADKVCETVCSRCKSRTLCWESGDDETRLCFHQLAAEAPAAKLTAPFHCLQPDQVTAAFSRTKRQALSIRTQIMRLRESQSLLFSQMKITEDLLCRAGTLPQKTYQRELTRYVSDVLAKYGIPVQAAAVSTGINRRLLIELYAPADEELDSGLIEECLSEALQKPLFSCGAESAGDAQRLLLQSAGGYCVSAAAAQCAVREDEPCGDCWDTFTDSDGAYYLAVSDGMGSGRRAALDAKIVLSDFRKLVQSGMECTEAARMINAIMMTKSGDERFATLDVAKICTDTAAVTLYKYGAGPTFIRHDGQIMLFQAPSNPIGILPDAEPYTTVLKLDRGDLLFLLSDGLDESLFPFVREQMKQGGDLQELAHAVCAKAQRSAKGEPRDDLTVLAAAVSAAEADA